MKKPLVKRLLWVAATFAVLGAFPQGAESYYCSVPSAAIGGEPAASAQALLGFRPKETPTAYCSM